MPTIDIFHRYQKVSIVSTGVCAFDFVWHPALLSKQLIVSEILRTFKQWVSLDAFLSHALPVEACFPKGSILGAILFFMYINSLTVSKVEVEVTQIYMKHFSTRRALGRAHTSAT